MAALTGFLIVYGVVTLGIDLSMLLESFSFSNYLNPITIYKSCNVNIFGCIILMIGGHLLLPWIAPFYWFIRLCTVGRR